MSFVNDATFLTRSVWEWRIRPMLSWCM